MDDQFIHVKTKQGYIMVSVALLPSSDDEINRIYTDHAVGAERMGSPDAQSSESPPCTSPNSCTIHTTASTPLSPNLAESAVPANSLNIGGSGTNTQYSLPDEHYWYEVNAALDHYQRLTLAISGIRRVLFLPPRNRTPNICGHGDHLTTTQSLHICHYKQSMLEGYYLVT